MAIIQCNFLCNSLQRSINFNVFLPGDSMFPLPGDQPPYKTLYLLHGYGGGAYDWFKTGNIGDISTMNNLAIVMPEGQNHFYVNDEGKNDRYSDYIRELVAFTRRVFPLSTAREDTIIGGISMGGFGSLINGMRHHDIFGHIVAISPALVKDELPLATDQPNHVGATKGFFESVFGDLAKYPDSDMNPARLAARLKAEGVEFPSIYLACGRNDVLHRPAVELHEDLERLGIAHLFVDGPGTHEDLFFYPHLNHGLAQIPNLNRVPPQPNPFWVD